MEHTSQTLSKFPTLPLFLLAGILFLSISPQKAHGQNRVTINKAQEVMGVTMQGERVRKLIGNVSLRMDDMVMYCDSAYQFLERSEVRAFGNIEIDTPNEQIYADTLIYFTDVDFSQLRGRVIIEADSATLFSQAVDYRFSTRVGHFLKDVRLQDPDGVLKANSGFYYREPDSAVFRGNVQISDSLQYIEGDSLFINRRKNTYRLYSNVFVDDRENSVILKGDSLKSDTTGHRRLEGNAWLKKFEPQPDTTAPAPDTLVADSLKPAIQRQTLPPYARTDTTTTTEDTLSTYFMQNRPDSIKTDTTTTTTTQTTGSSPPDTTHIRAQIIYSIQETSPPDTQAVINAYKNVRIWSPKFSAVSDTARYDDQTENFILRSNPTAWHKQIQLTGPYIRVRLQNNDIDELVSYPQPFVVQQDTTLDRLNQITGDTLRVNFVNGDISKIHVFPNSHLLRYTKNENDEPDGAIDMTAPSITLLFKEGALDTMKALGPVDGMYLPESKKTADRRLEGFVWTPDRRPKKPSEPMKRRLPPIPEDPPFELPIRYIEASKRE
ncbi:hypothetical protein NC796_04600 [Aliifodinibius sp. S!AR15-10]|uniref:OstA-like protein n=1 Tax=Aliifodinibius sp. S!AR15-10 TaxID=2950437 RepID=UPI0028674804|nr:OstA-like protein [Aliifodinibius sp. S!AR15-10]MDR8390410.1 hypothetical protein [Aliifodinibius sp. S!AR15-10]